MNALLLRGDVALTPLAPEHEERLWRWLADPAVREKLGGPPDERFFRNWLARALAGDGLKAFGILAAGEHVGNLTLEDGDPRVQSVRLSLFVGDPERRGQGIGAAAVWRACDYAFATQGRRKVVLSVHAENRRAAALYLRLGFRIEGRQREEFRLGERWLDTLCMGMLRRELPAAAFAPPG
jgi:RimJ/RimL family protein N-acetyltransferase